VLFRDNSFLPDLSRIIAASEKTVGVDGAVINPRKADAWLK